MAAESEVSKPARPKKEPQPLVIPKNATDEQRLKLERLMRNPDKPSPIPERLKEWNPRAPPEFVRDVMGSSAGAGSGEFHVYRHLRRREYQRQEFMDVMSEEQKLDEEFQLKIKDNQVKAEERTAKRRLKRQKLKEKKKAKKAKQENNGNRFTGAYIKKSVIAISSNTYIHRCRYNVCRLLTNIGKNMTFLLHILEHRRILKKWKIRR